MKREKEEEGKNGKEKGELRSEVGCNACDRIALQ